MTHRTLAALSTAALIFSTGHAAAQPIELTADPAQSSLDLTVSITSPFGTESDSDSAPLDGTLLIELTPTPTLTTLELLDYQVAATETLAFSLPFGPGGSLGTVSITGQGLGIRQPAGSPPTAGTLDAADAFLLPAVPAEAGGTLDVTASGLIGGLLEDVTLDLSTVAAASQDLAGTLVEAGGVFTLTSTLPFEATQEAAPGVVVTVTGTATIVATGTRPCPADVNGDGTVNDSDFFAWVTAFTADPRTPEQEAACDVNLDGNCSDSDFFAWVTLFIDGC